MADVIFDDEAKEAINGLSEQLKALEEQLESLGESNVSAPGEAPPVPQGTGTGESVRGLGGTQPLSGGVEGALKGGASSLGSSFMSGFTNAISQAATKAGQEMAKPLVEAINDGFKRMSDALQAVHRQEKESYEDTKKFASKLAKSGIQLSEEDISQVYIGLRAMHRRGEEAQNRTDRVTDRPGTALLRQFGRARDEVLPAWMGGTSRENLNKIKQAEAAYKEGSWMMNGE